MSKIPTAEEFIDNQKKGYGIWSKEELIKMMDKYANLKAKFHVEAALKAVIEIEDSAGNKPAGSYKSSILNAYPLTNIV